jgi:hypothetical protein
MKIECFLSLACGSEESLRANLGEALALEGIEAEIVMRRIDDPLARALGLRGSPSVLIEGRDIMPAPVDGFA